MIKEINYKSIVDNGENKDIQQFKLIGEYYQNKDYYIITFTLNDIHFSMQYNEEEVILSNGQSKIKMNRYQYLPCTYIVGGYKLEIEAKLSDIKIKENQVILLYHLYQNGKEIVKNYLNITIGDYLQ